MLARSRTPLLALAATLAGAAACFALVGTGFANYDLAYSLVWGEDVVNGRVPDYGVPIAPTPHPLAMLEGMLLAPLGGAGAEDAAIVVAFLALGALAAVVYALGATWFGRAAGLLAAAIVITRIPVLSFGARGYVDLPYVALVLGALLQETRRPQGAVPVLALLGLAGLLRPEAWLFSAAYLAYLWRAGTRPDARLLALAAAAPLLWALSDLLISGDALHSLTGTRETADVLQRKTGLHDVPLTVPRRLGEILREPVLLGAAVGGVAGLVSLRAKALPGAVAGVVSLVAFCLLAAAGLPILGRYLLLPAAILAVFCGAGVFAWRELEPGRARRLWQAGAAATVLAFVVFTPGQADRIDNLRTALRIQREIHADLRKLALRRVCGPILLVNHRPFPLVTLYDGRRDLTTEDASGTAVLPASRRVERNFLLDRNDPAAPRRRYVSGQIVQHNRSWQVIRACADEADRALLPSKIDPGR